MLILYCLYLKRISDFCMAVILLILLSPLFFTISCVLFFMNNGNIFFTQSRGGYKGKVFEIYKFKTMRDLYNSSGELLSDEDRMTRIGRILRNLSLDELPSLINIFLGDMSFVGPRPFMSRYLPLYSSVQFNRHSVKPGLTGWAQVNGRNAISWEKKFEYDLWYVDHQSFLLDVKIIFLTFIKVFSRSGVSSADHVTMPLFDGTKTTSENE